MTATTTAATRARGTALRTTGFLLGGFDARYHVKRQVGMVRGEFASFLVFTTAVDGWYLFAQLDKHEQYQTGFQFPVQAAALRDDIRAGLSHGMSYLPPKGGQYL